MSLVYRVGPIILILVLFSSLTACGPTSKKVESYSLPGHLSGLELDKSQEPALVYRRPGSPTFAAYNRFIIDPVKVDYTDSKMKELDPEQLGKMQQYFQKAMIKELREGGYEVGTRSQAGTMRISLRISNLKAWGGGGASNVAAIAAGMALQVPMIFAISVGEVTVEGVFRDSLTNRIDAVAIDHSQGSRVFNKKPWSTWADVEETFDKWAEGVREAIDKAHGR
ncbi:DUF3313 domain-containing protein [Nitrospina gracilis]|nr:DUF3313 domain-containing protein [Nitrospina gracilis]